MKTYQIVLLVIAAFIFGYLVAKLVKRNRNGKSSTPSGTISTSTITDTGTGIPIDPNQEQRLGCVPVGNYNGARCPRGTSLKLVNGRLMCC